MSKSYGVDDTRFISRVIGGEAVILDSHSGYCYSLNPMATEIWTLLARGHSIDMVAEYVLASGEIPAKQKVLEDINTFIDSMVGNELLVQGQHLKKADASITSQFNPAVYESPSFEKYSEIKRGRSVA